MTCSAHHVHQLVEQEKIFSSVRIILRTYRLSLTDVETGGGRFSRDKHGSRPESCPGGIRHLGGAKSDQALVWNVRTCRHDAKGDVQAAKSVRTRVPMRGTGAERCVVGMKVL